MPKWLNELLDEARKVTKAQIAEVKLSELCPHVRTIGVVGDKEFKQLITLGYLYFQKSTAARTESESCENEKKRKKLVRKANRFHAHSQFLNELAWQGCRDKNPVLLDCSTLSIRVGWQVVTRDGLGNTDLLARMLGSPLFFMFGEGDPDPFGESAPEGHSTH